MSDPRKEAREAIREAETAVKLIPDAITCGTNEQVRNSLLLVVLAQRRAFEWIDAIELI